MSSTRLLKHLLVALCLLSSGILSADIKEDIEELCQRLDLIERSFWRAVILPREQRNSPGYLSSLRQLAEQAYKVRSQCISYDAKVKGKVPDIYAMASTINRCYHNFSIRSKKKIRSLSVSGSGLREYQQRHNRLMREKAANEEETSDEKKTKRRTKYSGRPVLSQIDEIDYKDFLHEVSDKNKQKFYSWLDSLKTRGQSLPAIRVFESWQDSVSEMRLGIVLMAKYGKFKEEKKSNVGKNNRRQDNRRTDKQ